MTVLVTGASGFIGSHLVDFLSSQGDNIAALSRRPSVPTQRNVKPLAGDLLDSRRIAEIVASVRPGVIYHLGAQSLPGESWRDPQQTFRANVEGTLNLLEAVRATRIEPRIVLACSSSEYAPAEDGKLIGEDCPLQPSSPYGVSKLAVDHVAQLYGRRYAMAIIRARPFFLIGSRKTGDVCSDFARGIVSVERGQSHVLRVGNLDMVRDFLDLQDGVKALVLLAEKGCTGGVYNICAGRGYHLRDILDNYKGLALVPIEEETDSALLRPFDEKVRIGDPGKLKALGWHPGVSIEDSLRRILEYWRSVE